MSKLEFLRAQLDEHIDNFDVESRKHKQLYRGLRYTVFTLTAASAVLASLALTTVASDRWINLLIVILSATIGVLTSIEGIRKPSELWIHERNTHYALKDLKRELEYTAAESLSSAIVDDFFARLQAILGAAGEKWNRQIVRAQSRSDAQQSVPGGAPASQERP